MHLGKLQDYDKYVLSTGMRS